MMRNHHNYSRMISQDRDVKLLVSTSREALAAMDQDPVLAKTAK